MYTKKYLKEHKYKLLEKFVILTAKEMQRKEKALVVVKQKIGFDLGGSNEK